MHPTKLRIFLAGDSTVADYPPHQSPMAGWGQMLGAMFNGEVSIHNYALCGRSSKSFMEQGHLASMIEAIGEGDLMLIQFGHNDQKPEANLSLTGYQDCLSQYVEGARSRGALPVLVTPVQRRHFDEEDRLLHTHGGYPEAMKSLARELDVNVIDLGAATKSLYEAMGPEVSKQLFVWLEEGEHPHYPDGVQDNTHFNEFGALQVAVLVGEAIRDQQLPGADRVELNANQSSAK